MENADIAERLEHMGTLLQLTGANPFKSRAYDRAARTIRSLTEDVAELAREGKVGELKGIGDSIKTFITQTLENGESDDFKELSEKVPEGLFEILKLPGVGPKKVQKLWEELGITSLAELSYACNENRLVELKGFGKKSQAKITEAIKHQAANRGRHLYPFAEAIAKDLVAFLKGLDEVEQIEVAGSLRRGRETVKDLDILVASTDPKPITKAFLGIPDIEEVIGSGETKTSVRLKSGIAVDVRIVEPKAFPFALHYFTGSKDHNVEMRSLAREKGYSLNEYDLTPINGAPPAPELKTEQELFEFLGLKWVPPEMREGMGEIEAAKQDALPELLPLEGDKGIQGVLHMHTTASDGSCTIEQLCESAMDLGYSYIGITDHSKAAFYANGLDEKRIREQAKLIEKAREKFPELTIFHGVEADILPSGEVDLDDDCLEELDFVIASVHSTFGQSKEDMTARICKALAHPAVKVFGHPTGRILLGRKGYSFDWNAVLDAAKEHGVAIECNANPHRLDIDPVHIRRAKERGVKICINPDAHSAPALADTKYGVLTARRGWAGSEDVVNTLPAKQFEEEFLAKR